MIQKVTSNIESHDETVEIMNHVKVMATDSEARESPNGSRESLSGSKCAVPYGCSLRPRLEKDFSL